MLHIIIVIKTKNIKCFKNILIIIYKNIIYEFENIIK